MSQRDAPVILDVEYRVVGEAPPKPVKAKLVERPHTWADAVTVVVVTLIVRAVVTHFIHVEH